MTDRELERLNRLAEIAELKADQAKAALARATLETESLKRSLRSLDEEVSKTLQQVCDPHTQLLALNFAAMKQDHRAMILADLAKSELTRKVSQKAAQKEEGRRIALSKLRDQAS